MKSVFLSLLCLTSLQLTGCITFLEKEYVPAPDPEVNSFVSVVSVQGRSLVLGDGRCVEIAGLDVTQLSDCERKTLERSLVADHGASGVLIYSAGKKVHVELSRPFYSFTGCGFPALRLFPRKIPVAPTRMDVGKEVLSAGLARLDESEVPDPLLREEYRRAQSLAQAKRLGTWATPGDKLIQAVKDGNIFEVDRMLNAGADLNARHGSERLLLLEAALKPNRSEMVQYLLLRGADINADQGAVLRRLIMPGSRGSEDMASLLLERGADIKLADRHQRLLTKNVVDCGDLGLIILLVRGGAQVDAKEVGPTLLRSLARSEKADLTLAARLLDMGVDVDASDDLKQTPLLCAIYRHNLNMAQLLLRRGANVNIKDKRLASPISVARSLKDQQMVDLLKTYGAKD